MTHSFITAVRARWLRYGGIFGVCLASIAYEIFLARYFAVTSWSEYGYWIISIAMVGFAFSGLTVCLWKDVCQRYGAALLPYIVLGLLAALPTGFYAMNNIAFNPLELQNSALWPEQMWNIAKYYGVLFPFFFLAGLFVGVTFLIQKDHIDAFYTADLLGAGLGALGMMAAMFFVHPFLLPACVAPVLLAALPATFGKAHSTKGWRAALWCAGIALCIAGEAVFFYANNAAVSQYKPIFATTNVAESREVGRFLSPRGVYQIMDSFVERLDVDLSHNYAMLGTEGPPSSLGLYRDGERKTALPREYPTVSHYLPASLDALPAHITPPRTALLLGARGGFRVYELASLGMTRAVVLEPDPVVADYVRANVARDMPKDAPLTVQVLSTSPTAYVRTHATKFDLIDIANEYLEQDSASRHAYTVEGLTSLYKALTPQGILSVPVPIGEFTVYAVKTVGTLRTALLRLGLDPAKHMVVTRTAWRARILVSAAPLTAAQVAAVREFCSARSFDIPYAPHLAKGSTEIFNDLPPISFDTFTSAAHGSAQDALMDDVHALMNDEPVGASAFFDLSPATKDRPFLSGILRFARLEAVLERIDILPRAEIGWLVNILVLGQALVFAVLVLLLPLLRRKTPLRGAPAAATTHTRGRIRLLPSITYFMGLGLGFFFVQILLIEAFAYYLGDATMSFSLVIACMLVMSGIGAYYAERMAARCKSARAAPLAVVALLLLYALGLSWFLEASIALATPLKLLVLFAIVAPVSFFLGMPFPLGLGAFKDDSTAAFIPWAWGLNGAFSVVSTPCAALLATALGYTALLLAGAGLYALTVLTSPRRIV